MPRRWTKEKLIEHLLTLAEEQQCTPNARMINSVPGGPASTTYYEYFGSLREAWSQAGLSPPPREYFETEPRHTLASDLNRPVSERLREGYALLDEESER